jgi:predicted  nucleic acid-binding Zn-ribbon protein
VLAADRRVTLVAKAQYKSEEEKELKQLSIGLSNLASEIRDFTRWIRTAPDPAGKVQEYRARLDRIFDRIGQLRETDPNRVAAMERRINAARQDLENALQQAARGVEEPKSFFRRLYDGITRVTITVLQTLGGVVGWIFRRRGGP